MNTALPVGIEKQMTDEELETRTESLLTNVGHLSPDELEKLRELDYARQRRHSLHMPKYAS